MSLHDVADTVRCPIGVREAVSGDGSVTRRSLAHCDHRGEAVELMECDDCGLRVALQPATARRPGFVECRRVGHPGGGSLAIDHGPPVRLVMNRDVSCLRPDVSVDTAAVLLLEWHSASAPVVDEDGRPVGVFSLSDAMSGAPTVGTPSARGRSVADVMSPLVFTVFEDTELSRAAGVMSALGLRQLPVVRGDGSIVGLLSLAVASRRLADAARDGREVDVPAWRLSTRRSRAATLP